MGSTTTPTYRVVFGTTIAPLARVQLTPHGWERRNGRPTEINLARYVEAIADRNNLNIGSARLIRQSTGQIVATYRAPMFRVVTERI